MAARGCGASRVAGGIYLECPLSPYGKPLEEFICDPPIPVDVKAMGVTPVGVKLVERNGVWHVIDWVGSVHYPNCADFVEEVRHLGLSRRVSTGLDFQKLTSQSRILLLHSNAYIHNFDEYKANESENLIKEGMRYGNECPKNLPEHMNSNMDTMCARLWYQDVTQGESKPSERGNNRLVVRKMPSFEYVAMKAPENVKPDYRVAIFASFPITNLAVVKDPENNTHDRSMSLAKNARIPVNLMEE